MAKQAYTQRGDAPLDAQYFIATHSLRKKEVSDMIFYEDYLTNWMLERLDSSLFGNGEQFECPLSSEQNPNGGMTDFDTGVAMADFDPTNLAKYYPKLAVYNLVESFRQRQTNRGSGKVFDLYMLKEKITIETMRRTFIQQFWSGSGVGVQANGINILIPATAKGSQTTAVGEITPSGEKFWWRSQATDMVSQAAASELEANMSNMQRTIEDQGGKVDLWAGDQRTIEIYERNQLEFKLDIKAKIGDNNYTVLGYKGAAVMHSKEARIGELRAIDARAVKMAVDPMYWLVWDEKKGIPNVPFKTMAQYVAVFNWCRLQPRWTGCIFNITENGS